MKNKSWIHALAAMGIALVSTAAMAQSTSMPLNTGYDHANFVVYGAPGSPSMIKDNYWIKIASYEPPATSVPIAPAWVIAPSTGWAAAMANSRWIGARTTSSSATGVSASNPGYSIYRKCFCLMKGFKNARINFQLRADDNVQVWLNGVTTTLVGPVFGRFPANQQPLTGQTTTGFKQGKNCIYVLVEDTGGNAGFNLAGDVTATGLMPHAAYGIEQSFAPCNCEGQSTPTAANAEIQQLVQFAEQRRIARSAMKTIEEAKRVE